MPEGATIGQLKQQITENLDVPAEDITLSTNKDLVRCNTSADCSLAAAFSRINSHEPCIRDAQADVPCSLPVWTKIRSMTWPETSRLYNPLASSMETW